MNVREIIQSWLKDNGYDGLCNPDMECGCGLGDDFPCEFVTCDCEPAVKIGDMYWRANKKDGCEPLTCDDCWVPFGDNPTECKHMDLASDEPPAKCPFRKKG
jgi:hypothetical protein